MTLKALTPRTSDGKPILMPNIFPGPVTLYYAGAGDVPGGARGAGDLFIIQSTQVEDKTLDFGFNDWVYAAGGYIRWSNAVPGDYISLQLFAPATPVTQAGNNDGNCNVVNGVIIPAAGNGAYNVDLTQAVPVPAFGTATQDDELPTNGYWDWDAPQTGKGNITASATPGTANWHLIAAQVDLARFVNRFPLTGTSGVDITVPAIKPKKILPHWKFRATLHNSTAKSMDLCWFIMAARVKTI
jgi:hypothetical protein